MMLRKSPLLTILLCAMIVLSAACSEGGTESANGSTNAAQAPNDKVLNIGMSNGPLMFNPIDTDASGSNGVNYVAGFMFETLFEMTAPLEFENVLAESYTIGEDGKTFTITLKDNVKWTDGTPFTADDVVFTINLIANPKTLTTVGNYITAFDGLGENGKLPEGVTELPSVKAIDDTTVQFVTKNPVDPNLILERLSDLFIVPKHVLKDVKPEELNQNPFWQNPTVTTGPFKFEKYAKDQYVHLVANENYYQGKPKLDEIYIKIMPPANLVAQLQTGELHMNAAQAGTGNIPALEWDTVKKMEHMKTSEESVRRYINMEFNTEVFPDKRFRQALAYAIDKEVLINDLIKGYGDIVDGPYTPSHPYYDPNVKKYEYNPEKAKELLEEIGWDFNKEIELIVPTGDQAREMAGTILQQYFQQVGLKVKITNYDFATTVQKAVSHDFEMMIMSFGSIVDPDGPAVTFTSNGALNDMQYKNERVDELFAMGIAESDENKRKEIYSELQGIIQEEVPLISLFSDNNLIAIHKDLEARGGTIYAPHFNAHLWELKN
ncbi:ABC transporter substrate-binding protein [Virgibacillus sp. 6R]|uniref:ABC transporter substrate-binding protein n=1 Tax=Metabacillus sp. 22489 TaxID=3453928 RepID=UPI00119D2DD0